MMKRILAKYLNTHFDKYCLLVILALALLLRLYKINSPLADHHSWRQTDSAAVIRNLANGKFDLLHPRWNNLMATNNRGLPNPNRYFFEDFPPAFDMYAALLYKILGGQVMALRLPAIIFSLLTIVVLFHFVAELTNFRVAALAALLYAILPYSIFFSRGIFQEVPLNFYAVTSFYLLYRYLKKPGTIGFFIAAIANALLFLTKPYALIFLLPEAFLFVAQKGFGFWREKKTWFYFTISLLPFVVWWLWVWRFPEGIPYSGWLFNEGNIRFKGSFFYWVFAQRLGVFILGFYGILFFCLGLMTFGKMADGVFYAWLVALLIYVSVIAKGNVTHDYYQVPFLPVVTYFWAKGIDFLLGLSKRFWEKVSTLALIGVFLAFSLAFSWYEVRNFYNLQSGVDLAGDFIDKNTPQGSLIIAGDGADPTLLYNTNRLGWTVGYGSLYENREEVVEELRQKGADFYVTTTVKQIRSSSFERYLRDHYRLVKEAEQYIVFSLDKRR